MQRNAAHRRSLVSWSSVAQATSALMSAIEARDSATAVHSEKTARIALRTLTAIDPEAAADPLVELGFLFHDCGKIAVPDTILLKPGPLDADEWEVMRQHPVWGSQILERIACLAGTVASQIVRHHHERWDGTGYPDRLAGTEIPSACRAFAVIDAFDAMTCDRPYRRALGVDEAVDRILRGGGTQFDPDAVEAFLSQLAGSGLDEMAVGGAARSFVA